MKPYYEHKGITIYCGDCLEIMPELEPVDLIILDSPYNINKTDWDKIENYVEWMGKIFKECQGGLKDNGSFYFFHNDFLQIVELQDWLNRNSNFIFKQLIVWNKRFDLAKNKGFLDGFVETNQLRNYQLMAEYCLFYTFQDKTGLTTIKLDTNNFSSLRQYFKDFQKALGMNKKQIINQIGQCADHCFRWKSSQWDLPTEETYNKILKLPIQYKFVRREYKFVRREYEALLREYEALRREYEALRYTFNNQKKHHSVWNYEIAKKQGHITPKPVTLIENIVKHSSNKGDIILDPMAGSGTTGIACKKLERKFIGIEKEEKYCEIAVRRLQQEVLFGI